jgi:hypothetical protein
MGHKDYSNHRTHLFVGELLACTHIKPVTSARRAPDNADFVRIKMYLSHGFSANS